MSPIDPITLTEFTEMLKPMPRAVSGYDLQRPTKAQRRALAGAIGMGPEAAHVVMPNERTRHERPTEPVPFWRETLGICRGYRGAMN